MDIKELKEAVEKSNIKQEAQAEIDEVLDSYEPFNQDIQDLLDMNSAKRCKKCNRYYPVGYICPHCQNDNSVEEDEVMKQGDLRVWWIPQLPMKPFYVPVKTIREAKLVLGTLANYDQFQLKHHIKPDYANVGGLEMLDDVDGTGILDWCEWYDDEDNDINHTRLE